MPRLLVLVLMIAAHSLFAQNYRVAIATYADKETPQAIDDADISGVFRKVDQNKLFHYYIGDFYTEDDAEDARQELLTKGFLDARIVDLEEQRMFCGAPCPYFQDDYVYNHNGADGLMIGSVFFLNGGAAVSREGRQVIFDFAKILKANPNFRLHLGGHSDASSTQKTAIHMANDRIHAVLHLLAKYGIQEKLVYSVIFGAGMPLGGDVKYDRRVVLTILDSSGQVVSRSRATVKRHEAVTARR